MSRTRTGFAMIEVVMATAIIGGLAVGALTLVASAAQQKTNAANLARGQMLSRSLAEEISTRPVVDWSSGHGLDINIDLGAVKVTGTDNKPTTPTGKPGNRSTFTKIDDYRNYTDSPPTDEDGNVIAGYTGWTRSVKISPVQLQNPSTASADETGLRCIMVTTSYNGKTIATTTFLRSSEWERVQP